MSGTAVIPPPCVTFHICGILDGIRYGYDTFWNARKYAWTDKMPELADVRVHLPDAGNDWHVHHGTTRMATLTAELDGTTYTLAHVPWPEDGIFVVNGAEKIIPMREGIQTQYPVLYDDHVDMRAHGLWLYSNGTTTVAYHRRVHRIDTEDLDVVIRSLDDTWTKRPRQDEADAAAERIGKAAKMRGRDAQVRFGYTLVEGRVDYRTFRAGLERLGRLRDGTDVPDVRDDMSFKSVETSATLYDSLFRAKWSRAVKRLDDKLKKKPQSFVLGRLESVMGLTEEMVSSLSSGRWECQQGMTQAVQDTCDLSRVSQGLRVTAANIRPENKCTGPRMLHMSSVGYYCVNDTPEGQTTGLSKSLTVLSRVVPLHPPVADAYVAVLRQVACTLVRSGRRRCFVDGTVISESWNGADILGTARRLRDMRRTGELPGRSWKCQVSVSIHPATGDLEIRTYAGRVVRPLVCLTEYSRFAGLHDLDDNSVIAWVDASEERSLHVAVDPASVKDTTTHVEPYVPGILSIASSTAISSQCNQSPRNVYQASMGKQAVGGPTVRTVRKGRYMWYAQRPLVESMPIRTLADMLGPSGGNAVVLFHAAAFNQEDSIVFNQSSIDMGFMHTTRVRETVVVTDPKEVVEVVPMGARLDHSDVLLRTATQSVEHCGTDGARLDEHLVQRTPAGTRHVLRVSEQRRPEIGNKFASRSAQKATIGVAVPKEELPFTSDGIVPDIVVNPHCLPSRMTIAHLFEAAWGKACLAEGTFGDGTTFRDLPVAEVYDGLRKHGMSWNATFHNPATGMPMRDLYVGVIHYQVLTHFACEKAHARGTGPEDALTRQPCAGRSKGGGQKCGEMEKDVLISHGATDMILDRMLHCSDKYETDLCPACGRMGTRTSDGTCKCSAGVPAKRVCVPYSTKLLIQEAQSMHISMQLEVS